VKVTVSDLPPEIVAEIRAITRFAIVFRGQTLAAQLFREYRNKYFAMLAGRDVPPGVIAEIIGTSTGRVGNLISAAGGRISGPSVVRQAVPPKLAKWLASCDLALSRSYLGVSKSDQLRRRRNIELTRAVRTHVDMYELAECAGIAIVTLREIVRQAPVRLPQPYLVTIVRPLGSRPTARLRALHEASRANNHASASRSPERVASRVLDAQLRRYLRHGYSAQYLSRILGLSGAAVDVRLNHTPSHKDR
jgi:hypothetical protein